MSSIDDIDRRLGNLLAMLQRLGLDPAAFSTQRHGRYLAAAIPGCLSCRHEGACRQWLGRPTAPAERAPAFCPNAQVLAWARQDLRERE
jgi:hypothetical protein